MCSKKKIFLVLSTVILALTSGVNQGYGQGERIPVLIDTDMGLDDVRALYALLPGKGLAVQGVLTVEGSTSLGKGTDHLIGFLETAGQTEIPVFQGIPAPKLNPPPWREVANRLGGCPFPPPRVIKAKPLSSKTLIQILKTHQRELHYLALGPLGNLATLEKFSPGMLKQLHTVWIPVESDGKGKLKAWNLLWDKASTEEVYMKASRIVLIDLATLGPVKTNELLSSVEKESLAGQWITKLIAEMHDNIQHIEIYDELAAIAMVHPVLLEVGKDSWALNVIKENCIRIERHPRGNLFMASFRNPKEALARLKESWNRSNHVHVHHDEPSEPISARGMLKSFHGHLGPYVVLGYRMGKLALERTGTHGHFGISAKVHTVLSPPPSCLIDGIQLGSGCTLGKRNIEIFSTDGPAYAIFETKGGASITIRLKEKIPHLVTSLVQQKGVESAGEIFLKMDSDSLFEVEKTKR